jgi:hypothetical protein
VNQQRFRIKSLVFERFNNDGTTEDVYLEDQIDLNFGMGYIKFLSASSRSEEPHRFWVASSHDGLTDGTNVIANGLPGVPRDPEIHKDRTNTMIGLIRDNACTAYVVYSPGPVELVKP